MIPETLRNFQAEKALLGLMLTQQQALLDIMKVSPSPEIFASVPYKQVFKAMADLYQQGKVVDLVNVGMQIKDTETEVDLFNGAMLLEIFQDAPVVANPFDFLKRINDCHVRKLAWYETNRAQKALEHPATDVFTHLVESERKAAELVGILLSHSEKEGEDTAYKKFPFEVFPIGLATFLEQAAESFPVDPGYMFLPALVTFSACIGSGRVLECKQGWYEPPLLWGCLIGEPSSLKTPATKCMLKPLWAIEKDLAGANKLLRSNFQKRMAEWKVDGSGLKGVEAVEHAVDVPEEPDELALLLNDCTLEAAAIACAANPRGMVLYRNELGGWLRGFGKYSNGNGDSGEMNEWCEYWDSIPGVINRKHGTPKRLVIPNKAMSVFGTIPPETLAQVASDDKFESGFMGRILFTMPPRRMEQWSHVVIEDAAMEDWTNQCRKAYNDNAGVLEGLEWKPKVVKMTASAQKIWREWYDDWGKLLYTSQGEILFGLAKLKGYAGRIALVLAAMDYYWGEKEKMVVNQHHVTDAISVIQWFSREMVRVYKMVTTPKQMRKQNQLEDFIRSQNGEITVRGLMRSNPTKYPDADQAVAVLETLVRSGKGRWETRRKEAGGAPSKVFKLAPAANEGKEGSA